MSLAGYRIVKLELDDKVAFTSHDGDNIYQWIMARYASELNECGQGMVSIDYEEIEDALKRRRRYKFTKDEVNRLKEWLKPAQRHGYVSFLIA